MSIIQRFWWSRLESLDKRYDRKRAKVERIECPVKRQSALQKINEEWFNDYTRIMGHIGSRSKGDDW